MDHSMRTKSPLSELDMVIIPTEASQDLGQQFGPEIEIAMKSPARKRTLIEVPVTDSYKKRILENEKQKSRF